MVFLRGCEVCFVAAAPRNDENFARAPGNDGHMVKCDDVKRLLFLTLAGIGFALLHCGFGAYPLGGLGFAGITTIDSIESDSMRINWTAGTDAQSYQVFRVNGTEATVVATVAATNASYTMLGLNPETTYTFRVRMTDSTGRSDTNTSDVSATTLSTGAAAAAAGLPQLSSLKMWFKASSGITKNASDTVSAWKDDSGSSNDFGVDSGQEPTWVNAVVNGRPIVRCGAAKAMRNLTFELFSSAHTIFLTAAVRSRSTRNGLLGFSSQSAFMYGYNTVLYPALINGGSISDFGPDLLQENKFFVFTARSSGLSGGNISATGYLDGSQTAQTPSLSTVSGGNGTALNRHGTGDYGDADYAEILIYSIQLTDSDRQKVEDYLGARYAITINH